MARARLCKALAFVLYPGHSMLLTLPHFPALLLFAAIVSVAFAFMVKSTARERLRYTARSFFYFVFVSLIASWLMFAFQR